MPKFRYIVVNKENRQLSGMVDAPTTDTARAELQELGFSIVSLDKTEDNTEEAEGILFEFAGIDKHNKNLAGTIRGESRYEAFKRLMTEYELDIKFIVQSNLNDKEKEEQKKAGIIDLMKLYQEEVKKMTNLFHEKKIKNIDRTFEKEKALLLRQINYVLEKVNKAIDSFGSQINPSDKQEITTYVNKVLRLKNSSNLEYIKNTTKSLLQFIQNVEINVTKKAQVEAKIELQAETQDMINSIQKGKDFSTAEDLEDKLTKWRTENVLNQEKTGMDIKLKDFFVSLLIKIIHEDPELKTLKKELLKTNNQIKQYTGLFVKAPNAEYRKQITLSIKRLNEKKKEIKSKIHQLKQSLNKQIKEIGSLNPFERFIDLINGLSGWLLFFYLILYFVSEIIITKQIPGVTNVPTVFYLFQTGNIKYILPVIFLLHTATSMKMNLFRKNIVSDFIIFPLFIIGSLLIVFNF